MSNLARATDSAARNVERPTRVRSDLPARDLLVSRFASGTLSAALPWLVTQAGQLRTVDGNALTLRGISLGELRAGALPLAIPNDWPLNVVRITVPTELDAAKLATLDELVVAHAEAGAYTILVAEVRAQNEPPAGTEQIDITGLLALAAHYAEEPCALFEPILPTAASADDAAETSLARDARRMRSVLAPLRAVHPRALCLVPAPDNDLPLVSDGRGIPNLLYTLNLQPGATSPTRRPITREGLLPRFVADWALNFVPGLRDETRLRQLAAAGIGWAASAGVHDWMRVNRGGAEPTAAGRWLLRALTLAALWDPIPMAAA